MAPSPAPSQGPERRRVKVAIVGAGFAGLGMAIGLLRNKIKDFVILEASADVGGTWRANTYPGCACDIPSQLYSFSFAPNPEWSRRFAPQPEIQHYLADCARHFDVLPHVRFGTSLTHAQWDNERLVWQLTTNQEQLDAEVLISAQGPLAEPAIPRVPGLDSFTGQYFHSAQWQREYDLTGKKVALIGSGASAIQIVPSIQPQVGRLTVFQRSAPWILPRGDRAVPPWQRQLFRRLPWAMRVQRTVQYWSREATLPAMLGNQVQRFLGVRQARAFLGREVNDPQLRAALTPRDEFGCKRILLSDDYYSSLTRPNVKLVPSGIARITKSTVVASDGSEHGVDAIVFATGFRVTDTDYAQKIVGYNGRSLADVWQGSPQAYLGTAVADFPNLFLLLGPNTGLGHNSVVLMAEAQVKYILEALRIMTRKKISSISVRPETQDAYNAMIDRQLEGTVWASDGCNSWYRDGSGRVSTIWPGSVRSFRNAARSFNLASYRVDLRGRATARRAVALGEPSGSDFDRQG